MDIDAADATAASASTKKAAEEPLHWLATAAVTAGVIGGDAESLGRGLKASVSWKRKETESLLLLIASGPCL